MYAFVIRPRLARISVHSLRNGVLQQSHIMRFDVITIFPQIIDSYLGESIIKRAREKKLIQVYAHNLRDFSPDKKHNKVDDRPYGGGAGMVLGVEALSRALAKILRIKNQESGKKYWWSYFLLPENNFLQRQLMSGRKGMSISL